MSAQLNITVGTLTVGINNLVKKDLWNVIRLSVTEGLLKIALTKRRKKIYALHEKIS